MITNEFGHWIAGLIAGEGCFRIHKARKASHYSCNFFLKLRDDGAPILTEIVEKTGIGYLATADIKRQGNAKPLVRWSVISKTDAQKLVDLLDQFPIRAKKARDYEIWREAVFYWIKVQKRGNKWHGAADYSRMGDYKKAIEEARRYKTR